MPHLCGVWPPGKPCGTSPVVTVGRRRSGMRLKGPRPTIPVRLRRLANRSTTPPSAAPMRRSLTSGRRTGAEPHDGEDPVSVYDLMLPPARAWRSRPPAVGAGARRGMPKGHAGQGRVHRGALVSTTAPCRCPDALVRNIVGCGARGFTAAPFNSRGSTPAAGAIRRRPTARLPRVTIGGGVELHADHPRESSRLSTRTANQVRGPLQDRRAPQQWHVATRRQKDVYGRSPDAPRR
jgi:hypothetical protein